MYLEPNPSSETNYDTPPLPLSFCVLEVVRTDINNVTPLAKLCAKEPLMSAAYCVSHVIISGLYLIFNYTFVVRYKCAPACGTGNSSCNVLFK
jgi:hypothetical protein